MIARIIGSLGNGAKHSCFVRLMSWYWQVDGWMVLAGVLCAVACALVGNFLVLRRLSLIGDAISHAVLPGIAGAFLWTGSRSTWVALAGAIVVGIVTVWLTELIRKHGSVEESAAIGVVFTALFALGIMMVSRAENVDLDPSCVLYGNLETIILENHPTAIGPVPTVVIELGCICLFNGLLVILFFRQWTLSTFDPTLAQAQGIPVTIFRYVLAAAVAVTCVVSFRAVGNILVVAMLIVPPATAFLCCNRLPAMVASSVVIAAVGAIFGHLSAISLPHLIGFKSANSAAMIAVSSGLWLLLAIVASPKAGLFGRWLSQRKLARRILGEDILALLYRESEARGSVAQGHGKNTRTGQDEGSLITKSLSGLQLHELASRLGRPVGETSSVARELLRSGYLMDSEDRWSLSDSGYRHAQNVVRSHRLWEQYLSVETGITDPRLHANAESLEHYTSSELRGELDRKIGSTAIDPHGKNIPPEG
jgi:manganese/zinc/iron transport system permease protein